MCHRLTRKNIEEYTITIIKGCGSQDEDWSFSFFFSLKSDEHDIHKGIPFWNFYFARNLNKWRWILVEVFLLQLQGHLVNRPLKPNSSVKGMGWGYKGFHIQIPTWTIITCKEKRKKKGHLANSKQEDKVDWKDHSKHKFSTRTLHILLEAFCTTPCLIGNIWNPRVPSMVRLFVHELILGRCLLWTSLKEEVGC